MRASHACSDNSSADSGGEAVDGAEIFQQDFVVTTSNDQLNFLPYITTALLH